MNSIIPVSENKGIYLPSGDLSRRVSLVSSSNASRILLSIDVSWKTNEDNLVKERNSILQRMNERQESLDRRLYEAVVLDDKKLFGMLIKSGAKHNPKFNYSINLLPGEPLLAK